MDDGATTKAEAAAPIGRAVPRAIPALPFTIRR